MRAIYCRSSVFIFLTFLVNCSAAQFSGGSRSKSSPVKDQPTEELEPETGTGTGEDGSEPADDADDTPNTPNPSEPSSSSTEPTPAGSALAPADPLLNAKIEYFKRSDTFDGLQLSKPIVDIVLVMDTSGSMKQEKKFLEQNIQIFMDRLKASPLNARVTAIGAKFTFPPLAADSFQIIDQPVGSHDGFGILANYLKGSYGFPLPLRKEATVLEAIIFTDDDGEGLGNLANDFTPIAKEKKVRVNAVVGQKKGKVNDDCEIVKIGAQYKMLATQTKGSDLDLCSPDWTAMIKQLSESIVKRSENRGYKLSKRPVEGQTLQVLFDGKALDPAQFKVDYTTSILTLASTITFTGKEKIVVQYFVGDTAP